LSAPIVVHPLAPRRFWQVRPGVRLFSFYTFSVVTLRLLFAMLCDLRIVGRERIPQDGPLILVSNHIHFVDPPLIGRALPRKVLFMAKSELFEIPVLGWIVRHFDAFPVRRGTADRQALRNALDALRMGHVIGLFPEGTRSRTGAMRPAHAGAALVALRGNATIVPVAIDGTDQIFSALKSLRRARVTVTFGEPFRLEDIDGLREQRGDLDTVLGSMMARVAALLPPWRRGVFADWQATAA